MQKWINFRTFESATQSISQLNTWKAIKLKTLRRLMHVWVCVCAKDAKMCKNDLFYWKASTFVLYNFFPCTKQSNQSHEQRRLACHVLVRGNKMKFYLLLQFSHFTASVLRRRRRHITFHYIFDSFYSITLQFGRQTFYMLVCYSDGFLGEEVIKYILFVTLHKSAAVHYWFKSDRNIVQIGI